MTREEMIQSGRNIDADYAIIRTPHDGRHPQVVYVLKGDPMPPAVGTCLDGHSFVEVINLKEANE